MADDIDDAMIEHVALLAKLKLSDEEKEAAKRDMNQMLHYIEILNDLDTENVKPMTHVFPMTNAFREDEVVNGDNREQILANAPCQANSMFQVPKTVR